MARGGPKKKKTYNYGRNRKRLSQKERRNGTVKNPEIRKEYNPKKVPAKNIREMGLTYDVNRAIPIPNAKQQMKEMELELAILADDENVTLKPKVAPTHPKCLPPKQHVADELEREAKKFTGSRFRLPRSQVRQITTMIDRYGFNYLAMERDRRNYEQETWRQFRAKIRKFLKIVDQCTPYLERKGWLDCDMSDPTDPRWKEFCTDDES